MGPAAARLLHEAAWPVPVHSLLLGGAALPRSASLAPVAHDTRARSQAMGFARCPRARRSPSTLRRALRVHCPPFGVEISGGKVRAVKSPPTRQLAGHGVRSSTEPSPRIPRPLRAIRERLRRRPPDARLGRSGGVRPAALALRCTDDRACARVAPGSESLPTEASTLAAIAYPSAATAVEIAGKDRSPRATALSIHPGASRGHRPASGSALDGGWSHKPPAFRPGANAKMTLSLWSD